MEDSVKTVKVGTFELFPTFSDSAFACIAVCSKAGNEWLSANEGLMHAPIMRSLLTTARLPTTGGRALERRLCLAQIRREDCEGVSPSAQARLRRARTTCFVPATCCCPHAAPAARCCRAHQPPPQSCAFSATPAAAHKPWWWYVLGVVRRWACGGGYRLPRTQQTDCRIAKTKAARGAIAKRRHHSRKR